MSYDSVRTVEAVEDSLRQAAVADTLGAEAADTTGIEVARDEVAEAAEAAEVTDSLIGGLLAIDDSAAQAAGDSVAADTSHITLLLSERPQLSASWYVRLASSMVPGARYLIMAIAENVSGAIAESQSLLILPEPIDTLLVPADTT